MEKAHADVFNVLLQLLDDGRLTDGQGRTVDFRNSIVIMTSNLGSAVFNDPSMDRDKQRQAVLDDVRGFFRPEFVNRIDEIVVFEPLGREEDRTDRGHPAPFAAPSVGGAPSDGGTYRRGTGLPCGQGV